MDNQEIFSKAPLLLSFTDVSLMKFTENFRIYRLSPNARRLPSLISSNTLAMIELQEEALLVHVSSMLKNEIPIELGAIKFTPADPVQKRLADIQALDVIWKWGVYTLIREKTLYF